MNNISEFDDNGNCIYRKWEYGYEVWYKYNDENNIIYRKDNISEIWYYNNGLIKQIRYLRTGYSAFYEYDKNGKLIYMRDIK